MISVSFHEDCYRYDILRHRTCHAEDLASCIKDSGFLMDWILPVLTIHVRLTNNIIHIHHQTILTRRRLQLKDCSVLDKTCRAVFTMTHRLNYGREKLQS